MRVRDNPPSWVDSSNSGCSWSVVDLAGSLIFRPRRPATVKSPALVGAGGPIDVCFIVKVALGIQAVTEGRAQAAEEGLSSTALRKDFMMGKIGVVIGWMRGTVGGWMSGRRRGIVDNAGCRRLERGEGGDRMVGTITGGCAKGD